MGAIHLYLVRHGESVDNVANLYSAQPGQGSSWADRHPPPSLMTTLLTLHFRKTSSAGSRDAPLTSHGVLQARRLGAHLATRTESARISHVFASNLQRAVRTAEAIRDATGERGSKDEGVSASSSASGGGIPVVQLPELREKHFGTGEGQKIGAAAGERHVGAEGQDAMRARATRFVEEHLAPFLACVEGAEGEESIVVVAHGIILGVLARVLQSGGEFGTVSSRADDRPSLAWSNTGFIEMVISPSASPGSAAAKWPNLSLQTVAVNCTDHLQGLRKTRGGIGSAKFDDKQKTLSAFFTPTGKKRKHGEDA
ncbi:phosphoglycerate mutase family protein [Colletotrichum musicola]|uniref:Phosphoglycerate mutase family protein n=1 Tax=Colletotrichum musicola TaxID=2175873 RepID=A0A8H6NU33_9PEZI|nr:phosphoglycerate mutase family protein [Colletotrichum musicola]